MEIVTNFTFLGSKITTDGDCSHEIKTPWKKTMTNLDSILKSRDKGALTKSQSYGFPSGHVGM